ncbi:unnamed protein product [Caenorhabditis sp. 36 PRJEB53466]|nr:unnamed protein product [Caenorhabditis sp. 36 PRJEB53466]
MQSLPYTSAFQLYSAQKTTAAAIVPLASIPMDTDTVQSLLAFVAMPPSTESDVSGSPSPVEKAPVSDASSAEISQSQLLSDIITKSAKAVSKNQTDTVSQKPARETRIKRPMNAFMVWSQERRQQISQTGQKFHNSDISKMLGAEWRLMAEKDKNPYVIRAKRLREEHFIQYPDYVYRPRRRKRVMRSSESVDSTIIEPGAGNQIVLNDLLNTMFLNLVTQNMLRTASS